MTSAKKEAKRSTSMPKSAKPSAKPDQRVELLFEIGAEEIPAGMLPRAVSELQSILERHLAAENYQQGVTIEPSVARAASPPGSAASSPSKPTSRTK